MGLIDADRLKRQVVCMTIISNYPVEKANVFLELIESQPTAYDIDVIVKQLEELKNAERDKQDKYDNDGFKDGEQIFSEGRSQGRFEAFNEVIKILKREGDK